MNNIIHALQVLFVVAWAIPLVLFHRQAFTRADNQCDKLAASMWFASLSVVAFPLKWLILGLPAAHMTQMDMTLWSLLYVAGCVAGPRLTYAIWRNCHVDR